jgi:hypothetical protein
MRRRVSATAVALAMVAGAVALIPASPANATDNSRPRFDRNGDGRADFAVVRPGDAAGTPNSHAMTWYWASFSGFNRDVFGNPAEGDIPVAGDFDGDGINDPAVYRPGTPASSWIVLFSTSFFTIAKTFAFGDDGLDDMPLTGDLNGDGIDDFVIFRPGAPAEWFVLSPTGGGGNIAFGDNVANDDEPALGDLDGDGRADLIIRRVAADDTTFFHVRLATGAFPAPIHFGKNSDVYAPGDYDNDGRGDLALVRDIGTTYKWFFRFANGTVTDFTFGDDHDTIAQNDYDGNGFTDIAVWRQGSPAGTLFIQPLPFGSVSQVPFGDSANQDTPLVFWFNCQQNLSTICI